jgi:metallophosphoesterase (TIGR00282 family)
MIRVVFIGDIFARPGRKALRRFLPQVREALEPDFVIANGENAAHGAGITEEIADEILAIGIDLITGGNHTFDKRAAWDFLDRKPFIIRPANFPKGTPGRGYEILEKQGSMLAVLNIQGRVDLVPIDSPFETSLKLIDEVSNKTKNIVVDFHAEATSEKKAMGFFLDGKVSAVLGTHTHVQTADERILPGGTAYITDVGMCGVENSIIGLDKEIALKRFITLLPWAFQPAEGKVAIDYVVLDIDDLGKAVSIKREKWREP